MACSGPIAAKIGAIHEFHVRGLVEGYLNDFIAAQGTQVIMQKVHFLLLSSENYKLVPSPTGND
jgi:hypothetical protein